MTISALCSIYYIQTLTEARGEGGSHMKGMDFFALIVVFRRECQCFEPFRVACEEVKKALS